MTATRTEAVELESVGLNGESIAGGDFLLQFFDFAVFKLDDLATTGANEMIVVAFVRDVVVLCLRTEMPGLGESRVAKEVERPIDGGQSQVGVGLGELVIHSFGGDVFLSEECREDEFTLTGEFQLVLSQMLLEHIHFFCKSAGRHGNYLHTDGH
jgi:hypothetical protein